MNTEEIKIKVANSYGFISLMEQATGAQSKGESDEVRQVILERVEQFAVTRSHHYFLAWQWLELDHARATVHIDRLAKTYPRCPRPDCYDVFGIDKADLFDLHLRCGRVDAAIDLVTRSEQGASTCTDWIRCATKWAAADRNNEVRRCLTRAFEFEVDQWDHLEAAGVLLQIGDIDAAQAHAESLLGSMHNTYDLVTVAHRFVQIGHPEVSQQFLDAAMKTATQPQDHIDCSQLAIDLGQPAAARKLLAKNEPEALDNHASRMVATQLHLLGDHAAAAAGLLATIGPTAEAYEIIDLGKSFVQIERTDLATEALDRAIAMNITPRGWLDCAQLAVEIDDQGRARNALERADEVVDTPEDFMQCAGLWRSLGDIGHSRASMESALNQARSRDVCLRLTRYAAGFGEPDYVARAFHNAEAHASTDMAWLACADAHADYGNLDAALRCLRMADACSDVVGERRECADRWGELVDRDAALDCLSRTEKFAEFTYEWLELATHYHHLDAAEAASRCMQRALEDADDSNVRLNCVTTFLAIGNRPAAQGLIDDLRQSASGVDDWLGIADIKLLDEQTVVEALRQAETTALTTVHFAACVDAHKLRSDQIAVRRCLARGDEVATSIDDWLMAARGWSDIDEPGSAAECANRAVQLAASTAEIIHLAENLTPINKALGLAQLEVAEARAESLHDILSLAMAWHGYEFNIPQDEATSYSPSESSNTRRCIERALPLAANCQDHLAIGHTLAWVNYDGVREQLELAESLAKTDDDWYSCAFEWDECLGDDEAEQRCRRKADSMPEAE